MSLANLWSNSVSRNCLLLTRTHCALARPQFGSCIYVVSAQRFHAFSFLSARKCSPWMNEVRPHFLGYLNATVSARHSSTLVQKPRVEGEKDVIIYRYENDRYFRLLNIFGYVMWCLGIVTASEFLGMETPPQSEDKTQNLPWFARFDFRSDFAKYLFAALTGLFGFGCLAASWTLSLRSVYLLILRKGRKEVSIITYNPTIFRRRMIHTVNISDVSCQGSREKADMLPLKVRGKWFHFLLNKKGEYMNTSLFDQTVGIHRGF